MAQAYIGVGSNLDDPEAQVRRGLELLRAVGEVLAVSSLYDSRPWGEIADQPSFVNAVVLLRTHRTPRDLLDALKRAEVELGRAPGPVGGPRRIDFDILTYDDAVIDDDDLRVPHPRMLQRAFVLQPLAELAPSYATALAALDERERASVTKRV